jgi:hypothetical protein
MANIKINYPSDIWVKNSDDNFVFIPWNALKSIAINKHEAIIYFEGGTAKFDKGDEAYQTIKNYAVAFEGCEKLLT